VNQRILTAVVCTLAAPAFLACGAASKPTDGGPEVDAGEPDSGPSLCIDGVNHDGGYPGPPYAVAFSQTVPDFSFTAAGDAGEPLTIALHDYYEPCAAQSRLLILRIGAAFCGTCRWQLAHTADLFSLSIGSRLELLDLELSNEDNVLALSSDLAAYGALIDAPRDVAADPAFQFSPALAIAAPLPLLVILDTRTMRLMSFLNDPSTTDLAYRLYSVLAELDGTQNTYVPPAEDGGADGFSAEQWQMIQGMALVATPPPDPTNAHADDPAAAALGQALFSDKSLSPSGTVSCATCHDPTKVFTDGRAQAVGLATGDRNTPSIALAAHSRWQFWDGRADSLWSQALGPIENPKEFGASRLSVAHAIFDNYKAPYEAVFGSLPNFSDTARFPAAGMPGDPAWTGMRADDQLAVNQVFANFGKSVAAFERTFRVLPNAFDRYAAGDFSALTSSEKKGLNGFFVNGCAQCHYGPRLTDDAFHNVRFPTGRQDGLADRGRIDGIPVLLGSDFLASGAFSDSPSSAHGLTGLTADPSTLGGFKTPTLRGIASTAPFGHGGTLPALIDVVKNYGNHGLAPDDTRAAGVAEPWLPKFMDTDAAQIIPFLQVLTADPAP
jgi:cytochrome c peroxidase